MRLSIAKKMALWSDLEGRVLEGRYRLGRLVRSEGRVAWFDAEAGDERRAATISMTETLNDEDVLLERLRAASRVRHPNVVAIHEAGIAKLEGMPLVYAVMEPVEQSLNDVLRQRTLTAAETCQVLNALVEGLGALHEKGLVHGRVDVSSVVATGETVKLRSDCVQIIEPGTAFEAAAAEDLRGLGTIIGQVLPQQRIKEESERRPVLAAAPPTGVIRHEVKRGSGVVPMPAAPKAGMIQEKPETKPEFEPVLPAVSRTEMEPPPASVPAIEKDTVSVTNAAQPVPKVAVPDHLPNHLEEKRETAKAEPQMPLRFEERSAVLPLMESSMTRRSAPYIVAAAVVVLIVLGLVLRGVLHTAPKKISSPVPQATSAGVSPAPVVAHAALPAASAAASASTKPWRVVAYTYNRKDQAEQKARTIAEKHPDFAPEVFSPNGRTYLVTLGGGMDRDESFKMRAEALRAGMPGDTYARNFRAGTVVAP